MMCPRDHSQPPAAPGEALRPPGRRPSRRRFDMRGFVFKPRSGRGDTGQGDLGAAVGVRQLHRPTADAARSGQEEIARGPPPSAAAACTWLEEAAMEEHFVWMTTRRIKPGTL